MWGRERCRSIARYIGIPLWQSYAAGSSDVPRSSLTPTSVGNAKSFFGFSKAIVGLAGRQGVEPQSKLAIAVEHRLPFPPVLSPVVLD